MFWNKDLLFCDINPTCYAISVQKEICKRHLQDLMSHDKIAKEKQNEVLPNLISSHQSNMIKRAPGVELLSQTNKAFNINLASEKINGIVIHPGEVFSFWKTVGKASKRKGYKEGRIMHRNNLVTGIGGGLCNLGNTIHLLLLHSPLDVTEFHNHSDALAPDEGERIPFSAGTSVSYNSQDYRFKNNTTQDIQLRLWCEGEMLLAELRSDTEFPWTYRIVEEDHHFTKEGTKYYRVSKIFKETLDRQTGNVIAKDLVWDNHSEVMYDYDLIPRELIH